VGRRPLDAHGTRSEATGADGGAQAHYGTRSEATGAAPPSRKRTKLREMVKTSRNDENFKK